MPRKKGWFNRIKDILFPNTDKGEKKLKEKKKKKKQWIFGWMRTTKRPPSLAAPSVSEGRTENKALIKEEEINHCVDNVAAEPSSSPPFVSTSTSQCENKESECQIDKACLSHAQFEDVAATKIQTAFRGYLARKALRALKGLVRLQAIIRGRAVRRQAVATLKSLQSIVSIHSQVCATRYQVTKEKRPNDYVRDVQELKHDDTLKTELSSQYKRWDDRLITKEEEKTEATMRRHRMKAHSFNHRHSADQLEEARRRGRLRSWLEEEEVPQMEEIKRVDTIGGKQMLQESPRKAVHRRKRRPPHSMSDCGRVDAGEPAYMAATESARARARPTSCSPRLRPMQLDCFSDGDSPYKMKLSSPMSSINSERTWSGTTKCVVRSSCNDNKGINNLQQNRVLSKDEHVDVAFN